MHHISSNFRKRLEHKSAFLHGRVGNLQTRLADDAISGKQDIDVQNAWTFIARALPSHFCFDGQSVC